MSATHQGTRTVQNQVAPALSAEGLTVRFGERPALSDVSIEIPGLCLDHRPGGSGKDDPAAVLNRMTN